VELRYLYSSPSIIRMMKSRRMRRTGHVARSMRKSNAYRLLVGKSEEKRPLGRTRHRWVDSNRMHVGERVWGGVDWVCLATHLLTSDGGFHTRLRNVTIVG
jgi:hypothetical protein